MPLAKRCNICGVVLRLKNAVKQKSQSRLYNFSTKCVAEVVIIYSFQLLFTLIFYNHPCQ